MAGHGDAELALFIIRILSPTIVFLSTLSLFFTRPPAPSSPSPITSVVVATRIPRRALVLSLLTLVSLTFLLDGLSFVVDAVIKKLWPQNTDIEVNAIVGIIAFSGLAAIGTWKDVHGVQVWFLKRVKVVIALALLLDIAHVVILGLVTSFNKECEDLSPFQQFFFEAYDTQFTAGPHSLPITIPEFLHLVFPAFRVLLLVPLFFALVFPRVVYTSIDPDEVAEAHAPTASSFLLPPGELSPSTGLSFVPGLSGEASKYGTFRSAHPAIPPSVPTSRTHTPVPSNGQDKVCIFVFAH